MKDEERASNALYSTVQYTVAAWKILTARRLSRRVHSGSCPISESYSSQEPAPREYSCACQVLVSEFQSSFTLEPDACRMQQQLP